MKLADLKGVAVEAIVDGLKHLGAGSEAQLRNYGLTTANDLVDAAAEGDSQRVDHCVAQAKVLAQEELTIANEAAAKTVQGVVKGVGTFALGLIGQLRAAGGLLAMLFLTVSLTGCKIHNVQTDLVRDSVDLVTTEHDAYVVADTALTPPMKSEALQQSELLRLTVAEEGASVPAASVLEPAEPVCNRYEQYLNADTNLSATPAGVKNRETRLRSSQYLLRALRRAVNAGSTPTTPATAPPPPDKPQA